MKEITKILSFFIVLMVLYSPCMAEMSIREGRVIGQKEVNGKTILYNFDVPEEVTSVKRYKTEFVKMNLGHVENILQPYVQKPRSGDVWNLINSRQWDDTNFCYFEQHGKYACEGSCYRGPGKRSSDERVQSAGDKVIGLLEALNISGFEYPFYVTTSQCQSIETAIEPISSEEAYIKVKGIADSIVDSIVHEYYDKEALGKERNLIVVRFLIDGIPLCISDTQPYEKESDLDEIVGSEGIFVLNENDEVVRAQIRNYVRVVSDEEETREVLPWQDCIDGIEEGIIPGEEVTVTETELNLVVGKDGITYPVWRFSGYSDLRKLREKDPEIVINSSDFSCCVDAYSGQCLYY